MALICYHSSHEQFPPSTLLRYASLAEKAGFQGIHSSDHFHPWSTVQGQSGFTFSWIAAAMQATKIPFSMVCAPGQRYHPAIVAQAVATICELFPGRFDIELGSGEALNETITGEPWPSKDIRNERLLESVQVIRKLFNGEEVSHEGHIKVKAARLFTLPQSVPAFYCAALTETTSEWAGSWSDGLLTTGGEPEAVKKKIDAFERGGGKGKPVRIQMSFSYARNRQEAINDAFHQWRTNILPYEKYAELSTVKEFDKAGESTTVEDIIRSIPIFTDMEDLNEEIKKIEQLGVEKIILHNVNTLHDEFIEDSGKLFRLRGKKNFNSQPMQDIV
jgi:coenzyme F420-dependent glucose-6-phosphate dehydrogenase